MKYIYHHLGLGDHIICNGLVRSLIKKDEQYKIFVKPHNLETVKFMYRDLNNLNFIESNDEQTISYIKNNNILDQDLILAGFVQHPLADDFDDSFYLQNNIPFEYRWSKFKCDRDLHKEKALFNKFNVKENEYVFLHDDISRNYEIDTSYVINKDLPIIRPIKGYTENSFDYCYLMQNSIESHFIDSSFRLIFDSLQLRDSNIFFHINLKNNINRGYKPHSKLKFTII
jgi:hypothetical protein